MFELGRFPEAETRATFRRVAKNVPRYHVEHFDRLEHALWVTLTVERARHRRLRPRPEKRSRRRKKASAAPSPASPNGKPGGDARPRKPRSSKATQLSPKRSETKGSRSEGTKGSVPTKPTSSSPR